MTADVGPMRGALRVVQSAEDAFAPVLHVAPDPGRGWLVEAGNRRMAVSSYPDLEQARSEAEAYAAAHGWRLIVHDHANPAAGEVEVDAPPPPRAA